MLELDRGMSNDLETTEAGPNRTRRTLIAVITIGVLAGVLAALTISLATRPPSAPTPAATAPAEHHHDNGHDHGEGEPPDPGLHDTYRLFMTGWSATDPEVRKDALNGSATRQLRDGLMETDPSNVMTAPVMSETLVDYSTYSAEYHVQLEGVPYLIRITFTPDSAGRHGWTADYIDRVI